MGVVVQLPGGGYRAYFEGANEILANSTDLETMHIDKLCSENVIHTIIFYANQTSANHRSVLSRSTRFL